MAAAGITYDDSTLRQLVASLDPKRRLRAIRAGIRKEGKRVQKIAISSLKSSGLRANSSIEDGIRVLTFKPLPVGVHTRLAFALTVSRSSFCGDAETGAALKR